MYKTAARKHRHNLDFDINDDINKIKQAITDAAFDVRDKAGDLLTEKSLNVRDNVSDYASKRPFKTIGLSVLAGILVGFLLKR